MDRRRFLAFLSATAAGLTVGAPKAIAESVRDTGVLQIVVSLDDQMLRVFDGTREIAGSPISSGRDGHATPTGIFSILDKKTFHRSNIYSNAPMPFMQRLTWSGIALHASNHVPAYPASHGCVRMPDAFARSLYEMTGLHDHVTIIGAPTRPQPIQHAALFRRAPATTPLLLSQTLGLRLNSFEIGTDPIEVASAETGQASDASAEPPSPLRLLLTRRTGRERARDAQHILNVLGFDAGVTDGFVGRQTIRALKSFQREAGLPETGMLGDDEMNALHRAMGRDGAPTGHLYARRDFIDIFDGPVTIRQPELPLGTYLAVLTGGNWTGMTAGGAAALTRTLDRLDIPEDLRAKIEKTIAPGASLVISDDGFGTETGRGTDFIALTRRQAG